MRHTLITLFLSLIPLSAHAIIPLELVAEFDLPENSRVWDVQHWMDDSTFGWAAIDGWTIRYALHEDNQPLTFSLPLGLFDSLDWYQPGFQAISLLRIESRPESPIIALLTEVWSGYEWSFDHDCYHLLHVFDLEQQDLLYYKRFSTGYFRDGYGWNHYGVIEQLKPWPPVPDYSNAMYLDIRRVADLLAVGTDRLEITHYTRQFGLADSSLIGSFYSGQFDFFANSNGDLALNNSLEGESSYDDGSEGTYGEVIIGYYDAESNQSHQQLFCNTPCLLSKPSAITTNQNGRFFAIGNYLFSIPELELIDTLSRSCDFSLAYRQGESELAWRRYANRFYAQDVTSNYIDSTGIISGNFEKVIKRVSGDGEIVLREIVNGSQTNHILIYKPSLRPQNLIINYLSQHNYIWLAWDPVPGATRYRVCRMFEPNDVGNCDDVFFVTTTATQFTIDPNRPKEFYSVSAEFE